MKDWGLRPVRHTGTPRGRPHTVDTKRVIGGILFLFAELGIIYAAARVDYVSPGEPSDRAAVALQF
jgi:hypothetical protein